MGYKSVALKSVAFDTQHVSASGSRAFFAERPIANPCIRIDQPDESTIVRWLFDHDMTRALVLDVLGLGPGTQIALTVGRPFATQDDKPGDIDAILCDPAHPGRAVALECKRIKISFSDDRGNQKITKLSAFGSAYEQANALGRKSFARVFLVAIAVIDGRSASDRNFFFRGARGHSFQRIFDVATAMPLDDPVGVAYIEVVQPVEATFDSAAMIGAAVIKPASLREQGEYFTATVLNYLSANHVVGRPNGGMEGLGF